MVPFVKAFFKLKLFYLIYKVNNLNILWAVGILNIISENYREINVIVYGTL